MSGAALVELRPGTAGGRLAVGVAELAGLDAIRRFLDIPHLQQVHAAFEAVCRQVLSRAREVVVPRIGSGQLVYAVASADEADAIARALVARGDHADLLLPVRAGVATGTMLITEGRCYGPAVDLAVRRMEEAPPGTVACASEGFTTRTEAPLGQG